MRKLCHVFFTAAAVAASSVVFASETWYWKSVTTCVADGTGSYGYSLTSTNNWVNAVSGTNGLPVSGDIVIIDTTKYSPAQKFGSNFGTGTAFGGLIYDTAPSGNSSDQGTFTLQAGGTGIVANAALTGETHKFNGNVAFTGSGDAVVDLRVAGTLFVQKAFYGNANITLVKKGVGTLQHSDGYAPLNTAKTAYTDARDEKPVTIRTASSCSGALSCRGACSTCASTTGYGIATSSSTEAARGFRSTSLLPTSAPTVSS